MTDKPPTKARVLTRMKINEVSLVDRGAGKNCRIVISKRNDSSDDNTPYEMPEWEKRYWQSLGETALRHAQERYAKERGHVEDEPEPEVHERLNKTEESTMTAEELEAERIAKLHALVKNAGPAALCKVLDEDADAHGITEPELVELISNHDRQPGETAAKCFARQFEAQTPDGLAIRKAVEIAKAANFAEYVMSAELTPLVVGGEDAQDVNDPTEALAQLRRLAEVKWPELRPDVAFAREFTDPKNADLAARAHRRPAPTTSYPFPSR